MYIPCGCLGTLLEAVMTETIHNDMIALPDEPFDDSITGKPASRIENSMLDSPEISQLFL